MVVIKLFNLDGIWSTNFWGWSSIALPTKLRDHIGEGQRRIDNSKTFHPCLSTRKWGIFEKHIKNKTYINAYSHKTRLFHSSCPAKLLHIFTSSALATILSFAIFTLPTSRAPASDPWANLCTKHWSSWTRFPRYRFLLQQKTSTLYILFLIQV